MIRMKVEGLLRGKAVKVRFQDESRFGRINDPRRCWANEGVRPITGKQIIREYTYLYGAFCPEDGSMDSLILPKMDSFCMNFFLNEISTRYTNELILIVMDGAPCHKGQELTIPGNIRLLFLPPYCPQLNPSENMWDEIKEKYFTNRSFESMDELEDHLIKAANYYEKTPEVVKSICNWEWMNL